MDVQRTSIPRMRRCTRDGLGCCNLAPRETAVSELVARPRICTLRHSCGCVVSICCIQRRAVLMNRARQGTPRQTCEYRNVKPQTSAGPFRSSPNQPNLIVNPIDEPIFVVEPK